MIIIRNTLNFKLLKNNIINIEKNNVAYLKKVDKILFEMDESKYELSISNNNMYFIKESTDSIIKISNNSSIIYLKEHNVTFDINVEYLKYKIIDNKYIIEYKLESDAENTKIEIII